jgi:hypothetical protein
VLTIRADSTEYLRVRVDVKADDGSVLVPTGFPVEVGFSATEGIPDTFTTAAWVTDTAGPTTVYRAQLLVTAGDLTRGVYTAFVRITANPEIPVIEADTLRVR